MSERTVEAAIQEVMQNIGAVAKGGRNASQGFNFRGIDQIMNALSPVMAKAGLMIIPEVLRHSISVVTSSAGKSQYHHKMRIAYQLRAVGAEGCVNAVICCEAMDTQDKGANKALAIGLKYLCNQVYMIAFEAVEDPDGHSPSPEIQPDTPVPGVRAKISDSTRERLLNGMQVAGLSKRDLADYSQTNFKKPLVSITEDEALKLVDFMAGLAFVQREEQS